MTAGTTFSDISSAVARGWCGRNADEPLLSVAMPIKGLDPLWCLPLLANAEQFVRDMPKGLDTIVGDKGVRLSGGQRQRLALARAIIREPDVLILDEATSSLDSESEKLIQASVETLTNNRNMLIIVIAHRLSTIRTADRIYILEDGFVVVAEGISFN